MNHIFLGKRKNGIFDCLNKYFVLIRNALVIALLFVLLGPSVLTYQWLCYQKSEIRHAIKKKMKEGLHEAELVKLKFSKNEVVQKLRWEHNKEFEYRREMYDVVRTDEKGDSIIYYCWWDHKESLLNQKLNNWLEDFCQHNDQRKQSREKLLEFYNLMFLSNIPHASDASCDKENTVFTKYIFSFKEVWTLPESPPPQRV